MIYIQTALKPEAQAFVDYFKLKKSKLEHYTLFYNETIKLIISGMGVESARLATQTLINHYDITDTDIYCNVGVCAAAKVYPVGSFVVFGTVAYKEMVYKFQEDLPLICCTDTPQSTPICEFVDMESYGFYDAVVHNPTIKKFYILKVVSDHFEPIKVTKELAKSLIFDKMEAIKDIIGFS